MSPKEKNLLRSKIHRKIVLFFTENEGCVDTPRGVSAWINENIEIVRVALEDLVEAGFLKAHRTSSTVGYSCPLTKKKLLALITPS